MSSERPDSPYVTLIAGILGFAISLPIAAMRLTSAKEAPPVDIKQTQVQQAINLSGSFELVVRSWVRP